MTTPIDRLPNPQASLVRRAAGADGTTPAPRSITTRIADAFKGAADAFFGPGEPMVPIAQDAAAGRQFDYPYAVNTVARRPRSEEGENAIDFVTLRRLADPTLGGLDLVRLAIETRKDQMSAQAWKIVPRQKEYGDGGERAAAITKALRKPDGLTPFRAWQRMLIEDALVLDAVAVYYRRTKPKPSLPALKAPEPPAPPPGAAAPGAPGAPKNTPGSPAPADGAPPAPGSKPPAKPGEKPDANADTGGDKQPDKETPPGDGKPADGEEDPQDTDPANAAPDEGDDGEQGDEAAAGAGERSGAGGGEGQPPAPGAAVAAPLPKPWKPFTVDDIGCILEPIDAATLKRLISPDGRTPRPPEPAFQQQIKGLPATDYSLDDIAYSVRNPRSNRIYGLGPVEQVLTTINIALRRQMSQLEFYTAGNVPDMILGVPETWNPDQIEQFQAWWDSLLAGNTAERRKARFVPGGTTPFPLKDPKVKDEWDDWLARVVCYAFSLPYQALVKEVNRATAESSKEQSDADGIEPLKLWFKDVMDDLLEHGFDAGDMEFLWSDEEISDPKTKAEVWKTATGGKAWAKPSEARKAYGLPPDPELDEAAMAPPPSPFGPPGGGPPGDDGGEDGGDDGGGAPPFGGKGPPGAPPPPGKKKRPPPAFTQKALTNAVEEALARALPATRPAPIVIHEPGRAQLPAIRFERDGDGKITGAQFTQ